MHADALEHVAEAPAVSCLVDCSCQQFCILMILGQPVQFSGFVVQEITQMTKLRHSLLFITKLETTNEEVKSNSNFKFYINKVCLFFLVECPVKAKPQKLHYLYSAPLLTYNIRVN
jgi:hypothetical protein